MSKQVERKKEGKLQESLSQSYSITEIAIYQRHFIPIHKEEIYLVEDPEKKENKKKKRNYRGRQFKMFYRKQKLVNNLVCSWRFTVYGYFP